jgi:hypothetical protein
LPQVLPQLLSYQQVLCEMDLMEGELGCDGFTLPEFEELFLRCAFMIGEQVKHKFRDPSSTVTEVRSRLSLPSFLDVVFIKAGYYNYNKEPIG